MNNLQAYEQMSRLTDQMVAAARDNDWDRLCELEKELSGMRDWLMSHETTQSALSSSERQRKIALIKQMLADDREVRRHTEPWMDDVRHLLASGARSRNLQATYGSMR